MRPERLDVGSEGPDGGGDERTNGRTDGRTDERKSPCVLQDFVPFGAAAQKVKNTNQSPKGNMWSAIPVALLCMIVNWSERKQGSNPKGDEVL